ncbi:TetR/AcrR family transcriptional regulator [Nonomuraea sp. CA-143628]|uniref:TetR/AcrR family transcriptional regulator n=1 Tax=Nonomuraea sp. CA-143628 TaxID=3239997 RepID=UPI003D8DB16C
MPKKTDRRTLIADTAIELIDRIGLASVTHRGIDQAADLPTGTTSNYFRTRSALFEAIVRRLLELQLAALDAEPGDLLDYLTRLAEAGDGPARNRYLARVELSLEAARNPELAALMRELRATSLQQVAVRVRASHPEATDEQIDAIGTVLTGISLDRIALGVPAMPTKDFLAAATQGFLG